MKKILSIATVALVCGLSVAQPRPEGGALPPGNGQSPMVGGRSSGANSGQAVRQGSRQRMSGRMQHGRTSGRDLSAADQKLQQAIEEADSLSELMPLSRQAQASRSAEVRQAMVDALDGQGKDAANLLAAYIGDSDEDVANAAFTAWVSKIEDMKPARRTQFIMSAAQALQQGGQFQAGGPAYGPGGQFRTGGPAYGQGGRFQTGGPGQPHNEVITPATDRSSAADLPRRHSRGPAWQDRP